jgi:hypothetical protein
MKHMNDFILLLTFLNTPLMKEHFRIEVWLIQRMCFNLFNLIEWEGSTLSHVVRAALIPYHKPTVLLVLLHF